MKASGLTVLELLIVLAVIAICATFVGTQTLHNLRYQQFKAAANQLATDLKQARSLAQTTSHNCTIELTDPALASPSSYTVRCAGKIRHVTLPGRIKVGQASAYELSAVTFTAPYGELGNGRGIIWVLRSPFLTERLLIKTVGVTGKVTLGADD